MNGRVAFVILLLAGCDSWDPRNQALTVASQALQCNTLELTQTRENLFHAVGCGTQGDFACTSGHLEPHCQQVRTSGSEVAVDDESDAPHDERSIAESEAALYAQPAHDDDVDPRADESAAEAPASDAPSPAETMIRAGLDAHRSDIFACTQQDPTVVRVVYATDGTLDVHLSGALAGSPEEGCVRAALSGAHAPEGQSGVVLHLVHR